VRISRERRGLDPDTDRFSQPIEALATAHDDLMPIEIDVLDA
jgi:hypothetical protein